MKTRKTAIYTSISLLAGSLSVWGQWVPAGMNYQGRLAVDTNLFTGTTNMTFSVYTNATVGASVYEETDSLIITDGYFDTRIGDNDPNAFGQIVGQYSGQGAPLFLSASVGTNEFEREEIASVPFAMVAGSLAEGGEAGGWVDDGAVVRLDTSTDRVGIATTNPVSTLQVAGAGTLGDGLLVDGFRGTNILNLLVGESSDHRANGISFVSGQTLEGITEDNGMVVGYDAATGAGALRVYDLRFGTELMSVERGGNVGIGTGTNSLVSRLTVEGDVNVTGSGNGIIFPDGSKQVTAAVIESDSITTAEILDSTILDEDIDPAADIDPSKIRDTALTEVTPFGGDVHGTYDSIQLNTGSVTLAALDVPALDGRYVNRSGDVMSGSLGIGVSTALTELHVGGSLHLEGSNQDISVQTGENLSLGHYDGSSFVERARITSVGDMVLKDDLTIGSRLDSDDDRIFFDSASETLIWDESEARFQFSDDLLVVDDLHIGTSSGTDDDSIFFDDGTESIRWDESEDAFRVSNDLSVIGEIKVSTVIRKLNIAPDAFTSRAGDSMDLLIGLGGGRSVIESSSGNGRAEAQIHLPQGSVITELSTFVLDNAAGGSDITLELYQWPVNSTAPATLMAKAESSGASPTAQTFVAPSILVPGTINNDLYFYTLQLEIDSAIVGDRYFYQAQIEYIVDHPMP